MPVLRTGVAEGTAGLEEDEDEVRAEELLDEVARDDGSVVLVELLKIKLDVVDVDDCVRLLRTELELDEEDNVRERKLLTARVGVEGELRAVETVCMGELLDEDVAVG